MRLTIAQQEQLLKALLSAFQRLDDLSQMVYFGLSENLDEITGQTNRRSASFDLIRWAIAQGRIEELILAARERVPLNPDLRAFAESVVLTPPIIAPPEPNAQAPLGSAPAISRVVLEKVVNKAAHFANVDAWLSRMSEIVLTVCRVETPTSFGTGFLVGSDLVMTNHHVVGDILGDQNKLSQVVLRFDYRTDAHGLTVREGKEYRLNATRPIISSPFEELDFALLAVNGSPGTEEVGGQSGAPERKWLTPVASTFEAGQPLFVVQHPKGAPMKVAFDVVIDAKADRLRYRTNTEGGSSGSPCFNDNWELVALHHAGENVDNPSYNQGIPFGAILAHDDVRAVLGIGSDK